MHLQTESNSSKTQCNRQVEENRDVTNCKHFAMHRFWCHHCATVSQNLPQAFDTHTWCGNLVCAPKYRSCTPGPNKKYFSEKMNLGSILLLYLSIVGSKLVYGEADCDGVSMDAVGASGCNADASDIN